MEGVWKDLKVQAREALECCAWHLMYETGQSSEDQNANRNERVQAWLRRFQLGVRTPLAIGLEGICVTCWQKNYLCFIHIFRLCGRLILKMAN